MAPNDILHALRTKPFEPIRVSMTDGKSIDLYHPEMCMVGNRSECYVRHFVEATSVVVAR